jgi:hypothetical protein
MELRFPLPNAQEALMFHPLVLLPKRTGTRVLKSVANWQKQMRLARLIKLLLHDSKLVEPLTVLVRLGQTFLKLPERVLIPLRRLLI